ncbi:hypothetical protein BN1086_04117 [Citrobacter koseri]|uniref:Uncharacterized protein n=3 Tax=Enterobacteriaceae TaxID=543 RepID=A0A078LLA7_CITKO|nr:hypothetical protein BN1086_04117 [Citrobacter koseri]
MTKEHAQGVFIRFIDFRGELLLRASAIDGVAPAGKNGADEATYVYLNGTRLLVELPYQTVREIISEAEKARQANGDISKLFAWLQKQKFRKQIKGRCDGQRI